MGRVNMVLTDSTEKRLRFIMLQDNCKTFDEVIECLLDFFDAYEKKDFSTRDILKIKEESEKK